MWKQLQREGEDSLDQRTLDEIQHLQVRLEAVHERLHERMDRLEGKLDALPPGGSAGEEAEPTPDPDPKRAEPADPPEDPSPPPPSTTTGP